MSVVQNLSRVRVLFAVAGMTLAAALCAQTAQARPSAAAQSAAAANATSATQPPTAPASSTAVKSPAAAAPAAVTATDNGTHTTLAPPSLAQQIAKLPPLKNTGINVKDQSSKVLAHLNDMLRFYRAATGRVQKAGEPSDILYAEQAKSGATEAAQLAFQSARNEAALLTRVDASSQPASTATPSSQPNSAPAPADASRLSAARSHAQQQITMLQAQQASIAQQLQHASARERPDLLQKQEQVQGGLELEQATAEALARIGTFSEAQTVHTGLAGDIDRLENSAPELAATNSAKASAPAPLQSFSDAQHSGIVTQAEVLFDLLTARRSIDEQITQIDKLTQEAQDLRTPFVNMLRSTIQQGEALTQQSVNTQATPTSDAQDLKSVRSQFDQITNTFHALSDAMLPLSQEAVVLEGQRGTLSSWRGAVDGEYRIILRSLLVRIGFIALALVILAGLSTLWGRATIKYVSDLRRRRQLLVIRRIVVGFLGGLIVIFGFITQFSSLATFAGFITAGIAVGLQSILLSVAAYFFIIGRYGVRVGDRITVAGVTGTVIEVGLARFYLMELVGSGTELHSTGRVAVFANSVLFQTGTPLYKQLPGTEYAWHELTAKLKPEADADAVSKALCAIVQKVYESYKTGIEAQQREIEGWMGAPLDPPRVDSHLRMTGDALQVAILFPVEIDGAAHADAAIAAEIIKAMQAEGPLKQGLAAMPTITAAIKT
jgi:small-conductance mechanosensitive channel